MDKWQQDALKRAALVEAAVSAGAISPGDVATLYSDRVTVGEDGTVSGATEAIAEAQRDKGHWFCPTTTQRKLQAGTGGNPARQ